MRRMVSLFVRELTELPTHKRPVYLAQPVYNGEETAWVQCGYGIATRKWDGTACLVKDHRLYCRQNKKFVAIDEAPQGNTKWHRDWIAQNPNSLAHLVDDTYELCGPGIQGNPERFVELTLVRHGTVCYPHAPTTYDALVRWIANKDIEGLVWHSPGGRMIKIKKKDFALPRR